MADVFRQSYGVNPDGTRKYNKKWYGEYKDHTGKRVRVPLSTDKQVARSMLADLEKREERIRTGYLDPHVEDRKAPLDGLLKEYLSYLRLKGDGPRHVADMERLATKCMNACGFETVNDLRVDRLDAFLAEMSATRSARTVNTYRQAMRGFGAWLKRIKKAVPVNPFDDATKAVGPTKRKRRALSPKQLQRLFEVARTRPLREKLLIRRGKRKGELGAKIKEEVRGEMVRKGRERELLYKMAYYTGLRRGELEALRVLHLVLDQSRLILPGEYTKNGKDAVLPLRKELVRDLRGWIVEEGLKPEDPVFRVGKRVTTYLRRDMVVAGIPRVDERGRYFDFHAFRKCFATHLQKAGVPLTTAKELLRHSTVELTAGVYSDEDMYDYGAAISQLPAF